VNIVVAGGGTAGHVYPALAMADALRERHSAIVTFVGSYDGPESELVPAADILLVNERPGVAQMAVPSKLTSYFTSGKPILAATDAVGLTAQEITASGAGVRVPADRPDLLLSEAVRLGTDRAFAAELGEAGRRYSAAVLSADTALDHYERWVVDLADMRRRPRRRVNGHSGADDART
jgi:hypothetical protein